MQIIFIGPADIRNHCMHSESSTEAEKIEYCISSFYESSLNWEEKKKKKIERKKKKGKQP